MSRPLLGVTACNRTLGPEMAATVTHRYIDAVSRYADAAVVLLPALPDLQTAREIAARLDGVMLTGSPSNLEPRRYGGRGGEGPFDAGRDEMALGLIEAMADLGRPTFGVCRGLQEVNVAFGGTLRGDLAEPERPLAHHAPPAASFEAMFAWRHPVSLAPGGALAQALGVAETPVNSVHYQGVATLGRGLAVEAVAPDGVIEAVTADLGSADLLAVQWHPEWRTDEDCASQTLLRLFGRMLRGERLAAAPAAALAPAEGRRPAGRSR